MRMQNFVKNQSGFTLVELMIAGFLGLILIAGVLQLFQGSNQSYRLQGGAAEVQERGRFALSQLRTHIRWGGWSNSYHNIPDAIDLTKSTNSTTDKVAVVFMSSPEHNQDCAGGVVDIGKVVVNEFFLDEDSRLMCRGNGGNADVELIENVVDFQVLYGVENAVDNKPDCRMGKVDSYVNAGSLTEVLKKRVMSVRVGLVVESSDEVLVKAAKVDAFKLLDSNVASITTRKVRRAFQETILMQNAVYSKVGHSQAVLDCL